MKNRHCRLLSGIASYRHGCERLPRVAVVDYNAELRDGDGFVGDRASRRAFDAILDRWQHGAPDPARESGPGPGPSQAPSQAPGQAPGHTPGKRQLDRILVKGQPDAAGALIGALEEFSRELATVTERFLQRPGWRGVQHIAVGGGLRASRVGELAIGRASALLKADGHPVRMQPIHHHPDESALIGCAYLVPADCLAGHDAVLAVDIGGTNIRAGLVELNLDDRPDLRAARVTGLQLWRHADDAPGRDEVVARLAAMLADLMRRARKERFRLAPMVGLACPGMIGADGSIVRGGHNLPGDWHEAGFNLPERLAGLLPPIDGQDVAVLMHNDAVLQGLSEQPWLDGTARWAVLTIGTGLGNASFHSHAC